MSPVADVQKRSLQASAPIFLYGFDSLGIFDKDRLIYTEVIAGISVVIPLALLFGGYRHPATLAMNFVVSVAWIAAFALLVSQISPVNCGPLWQLEKQSWGFYTCGQWKVTVSFAFASGMAWLLSGLAVTTQSIPNM